MAGNSSIYDARISRTQQDLNDWTNWSSDINFIVDQFNTITKDLNDRLENIENTLDALIVKCNAIEGKVSALDPYIALSQPYIEISSDNFAQYEKKCGIFSNKETIYVFANKTVPGLFFDGNLVQQRNSSIGGRYAPFTNFSGSDAGTIHKLVSQNASKVDGLKLYFCSDPRLDSSSATDASIALDVKVKYSPLVVGTNTSYPAIDSMASTNSLGTVIK